MSQSQTYTRNVAFTAVNAGDRLQSTDQSQIERQCVRIKVDEVDGISVGIRPGKFYLVSELFRRGGINDGRICILTIGKDGAVKSDRSRYNRKLEGNDIDTPGMFACQLTEVSGEPVVSTLPNATVKLTLRITTTSAPHVVPKVLRTPTVPPKDGGCRF